jgi:hypothetical protein
MNLRCSAVVPPSHPPPASLPTSKIVHPFCKPCSPKVPASCFNWEPPKINLLSVVFGVHGVLKESWHEDRTAASILGEISDKFSNGLANKKAPSAAHDHAGKL